MTLVGIYAETSPGLGLDDRQRRQRSAAEFIVELRGPFEQSCVQVEDVSRISLAPRRSSQEQRNLPVGYRVLGKIIIDHQRVAARVTEIFAHRAAGVGGDILQRGRDRWRKPRRRSYTPSLRVFSNTFDDAGDSGQLLPDRHIEAVDVLALLVQDGVHGDGGLAGLAVADDEFSLASAYRDHRVNGLDACRERFLDRLPVDDAGRAGFDVPALAR